MTRTGTCAAELAHGVQAPLSGDEPIVRGNDDRMAEATVALCRCCTAMAEEGPDALE
jgi:hypothetical protein